MAKALKVFVILLLVLSIAALVLGIQLFGKREILKGRTQKLEAAVTSVATALNAAKDPFIKEAGVTLNGTSLSTYESMDGELRRLQGLAENRYSELDNTYADLKRTSDELNVTKDELAQTKDQLDRAQQQIVQLNDTVTQKNAEIARQTEQIGQLEQDKAGLQVQIDDLNTTVARMEDEQQDLKDKITTLEQTVVELEGLTGEGSIKALPKGLHGKIVVVNKDWNFVILDLGSNDGLVPNAEMLVHRGDKLIGKVQISGVTRELSIADINADWVQGQVKEGDFVAVQ
jgi:predicted RNase H-like nuclease (RuvC/YqgF family)